MIPDGVQVDSMDTCQLSFESSEIYGGSSYQESLKTTISADYSVYKASFTASDTYQSVYNSTSQFHNVYTTSKAQCNVYSPSILTYTPPPFTDNFLQGLNQVWNNGIFEKSNYLRFFNSFGTHVVMSAVWGSAYGVQSEINSTSWVSFVSSGFDINAGASLSALGMAASFSVENSQQKAQAESFNSQTTSQSKWSFGGSIPQNGTTSQWLTNTYQNPMPISDFQLVSIDEILISNYFPNTSNIQEMQQDMTNALAQYCPYLITQGYLGNCADPPGDPDPPAPYIRCNCANVVGVLNSSPDDNYLNITNVCPQGSIIQDYFLGYELSQSPSVVGAAIPFGTFTLLPADDPDFAQISANGITCCQPCLAFYNASSVVYGAKEEEIKRDLSENPSERFINQADSRDGGKITKKKIDNVLTEKSKIQSSSNMSAVSGCPTGYICNPVPTLNCIEIEGTPNAPESYPSFLPGPPQNWVNVECPSNAVLTSIKCEVNGGLFVQVSGNNMFGLYSEPGGNPFGSCWGTCCQIQGEHGSIAQLAQCRPVLSNLGQQWQGWMPTNSDNMAMLSLDCPANSFATQFVSAQVNTYNNPSGGDFSYQLIGSQANPHSNSPTQAINCCYVFPQIFQ
jgi:hypothetical protein